MSVASTAREPGHDRVELALVANRLRSIVRKMSNTLHRTGRSGVLNTARDFSCAIVTHDDRLLMAADSLPIHVLSGPDQMSAAMHAFHPELHAGDAFLHNSPYHGNSHPADHSLLVPVVDAGGRHRFTVLVKAHQADCGNALPTTYMGGARDVYAEGALIFPVVKIQSAYRDVQDVVRMCEMRIRVPEQWRGDYLAMVGAARIGERELLALGEELGFDALHGHAEAWFDYSEQRMVNALRRMPAGAATAATRHDPAPGAPDGIPVNATVTLDPDGATAEIDLRDNPDCYPCGLNLSEACAGTAAMIGLFNCLPETVPTNAGSLRRVTVHLRRGCVVGIAEHPTSTSVATTNVADRVTAAVQLAIAELADGHGMAEAGGFGASSAAVISGRDPRAGGAPFVNQLFLVLSGGPGNPHTDGWTTFCHAGNGGMLYVDSVEVDELNFPILVRAQRVEPDSEGSGRLRGAPSVYAEYGPLDGELTVIYAGDGHVNAAAGARGGEPGARAKQFRRDGAGELTALPGSGEITLLPGETIVSLTAAGGGYGPPVLRDPELVAEDVREGAVSRTRARETYRVVLDGDLEADLAATSALRKLEMEEAAP
ncbi:hydantoinase B/oxoprolinase family protein [Conexibacter woesei]|uniref:Hydantoinase B/oxoprolinase n=1 Tax=Conexibacter woesei (strain DSM 14684 / CCUG 47730 / CIP 108061 / JCM 11494 / NBRC 100937 / ID131577) TaxID=469383 RepID=D3F6F2_CONWI|nr:hydantoinase B/oxoprolinase family protein [Conexibacter woesei]ADB50719.1 Hydantoinase B/oxoprolinase [Conexibacter woesei DSM 14684]